MAIRRPSRLIALGALILLSSGPAAAGLAGSSSTITDVSGDKRNGFASTYAEGTADFPPTISEARAECAEYSTYRERLVCRVETRIWYRDLGRLRDALTYARS